MNRKLHDAILGLAIGDALGVPFEFKKRGTFLCTDMVGFGTHSQPKGTWSDDTSMVLATLDSLKSNNGQIVPEDMFIRFNHWLQNSDYTAHGEVLTQELRPAMPSGTENRRPASTTTATDPSCGSSRLHSCPAQMMKFARYLPLHTDIRSLWTPA